MSDLSIYELEDIIWDDFERSGDHIVPHPSNDHGSEEKCQGDSCKKPRHEETPLQSSEGNMYASGSVSQVKEESGHKALNNEKNIMEENSWSHTPDGGFTPNDADVANNIPNLQSGDTKISNLCFKSSNITSGSELCTDEGIPKDTPAAVDGNSYNYPPSHIRQSDNLNLFSTDGDDKDSSDLLYYGWSDIGNFEDMDRILSNCDSSLGLGVTGTDDELVWFTSDDPAGGYAEALKMDLEFPCSEPSALTNISQDHEPRESDNKRSSFISESKDEFKLKDQEQSRLQNHEEVKKAGQSLGNYGLKSKDIQISSCDESDQVFTSIDNQLQNKNIGHDSYGYMQSSDYLHLGHDNVPMQPTGGPMMTGIKCENKGPTSSGNQKQMDMMLQASRSDFVYKIESQSDTEGVKKGASAELSSLDVPEGSSISSELDEISLEATSFRQLRQVMEQLDMRTKLCIRDSLYRLARSAEQRHNYAGINNTTTNCGGTGGSLMTEGTNKCSGFMDMETDTNPIDRTIAHLLFHRPSDSSKMPIPSPLKPNAKVHGSTTGPLTVGEKQSCQEEVTNESADKISSAGKN